MWSDALAGLVLLTTAPGTLYLALLTLASFRSFGSAQPIGEVPRITIVVPAHNEGNRLLRTLHSLQAECTTDMRAHIVLVADNCSDDTAEVARAAGVQVLERQDCDRRGKGYALEFAFDRIIDADWFIVIDADTDVTPGFLQAMRCGMVDDNDALQCRYLVRDALETRRGALSEVAWAAWNVLRPRGRAALGLSAGILGNGFALSQQTLKRVPYTARSVVEDVEYHILLVKAGLRVGWIDHALVRGDMPTASAAAGTQRTRWEGGRLRLAIDKVPSLAGEVIRGRWKLLDPMLDLMLLPLAFHVALLLGAAALGSGPWRLVALGSLGIVALHVFGGLLLIRARWAHWRALLGVPAYVIWKVLLSARIVKAAGRSAEWVRTERKS